MINATSALSNSDRSALKSELPVPLLSAMRIVLEGADANSLPDWVRLASRARERAIVDMACAVIVRWIRQQPTLLLIEDIQWADQASAPALEAIANLAGDAKLFVLSTSRTGELPAWVESISVTRLALAALNREAGLAMLDQLLGASPFLNPLKARILDHTGMMPLFIEEVCRGLVEAGRLTGGWGHFEPALEETALSVPLTVQGVIASRIDRLALREKRVLQVAAAIGPQLPSHLLRAVCGAKEPSFRRMLTALFTAGMLISAPEASRSESHFRMNASAKSLMMRRWNRIGSSSISASLESSSWRRPGMRTLRNDLAAMMVHHAVQAREWARATELALAVARRCFGQSAFADAKRHLSWPCRVLIN